VFITAFSDPETLRRAWRTRPACILGKSGDGRELVRIAARFMQPRPGEEKNIPVMYDKNQRRSK
jgi:hypothetical protein